jgi:hypothetical protein
MERENSTNAINALRSCEAQAATTLARGETPVVIFDLDHTLFDNGPRTWAILKDFADQCSHNELQEKLHTLSQYNLPYLIGDILASMGFHDPDLTKAAFEWWRDRFFIDDWINLDTPLPGTVSFAKAMYAAGCTLVYLTGRDSPNMLIGTAASLRQHGFPVGLAHTALVLKPDFDTPDLEFKTEATKFISTLGTVIAAFDNEPANCNLFTETYPDAVVGFLDTAMAPDPPRLDERAIRMFDFRC